MFTIEADKTINVTRGDILYFTVSAQDKESGEKYIFQPGDIVRIAAYGKKDTENVVLQKDFLVETPTEEVEIFLGEEDTKFEDPINKAKVYWYEVVLNPDVKPQTIIGFDEDGAKIMRLYPEGVDINETEVEIESEDIPVMDDELNVFSDRPVRNKAIARAVVALSYAIDNSERETERLNNEIATERARITLLAQLQEGSTTGDAELQDIRVGADSNVYDSAGEAVREQFRNISEPKILSRNCFDKSKMVIGFYVKAQNPISIRENSDVGYYRTTDLKPGKTYVVSGESAHILVSCSDSFGMNIMHSEFLDSNSFTIPGDAANVYLTAWLNCKDALQIEEGTKETSYTDYKKINLFNGFLANQPIVVDKNGNGMYTTITDAVEAANDGDVILVMPAVYTNEIIKAWNKTVYIVGVSKKDCVIKNDTGDYYTPPVEICCGALQNLTIIHDYNEQNAPQTKGYAIHIENDNMIDKNLLIENCCIISKWNYAVGMGMRSGCNVEFANCDFIGTDGIHGGLFFHDCNNENGIGEQNLVVKNCNIFSQGSSETTELKIQSQQKEGSKVNVEFVNCNVRNITNGTQKITMLNGGKDSVDAVEDLTNFFLSYGSYGNNSSILNK